MMELGEVKHLFHKKEVPKEEANLIRKDNVLFVKVEGTWYEETKKKNLQHVDALPPDFFENTYTYSIEPKDGYISIAMFYHEWLSKKRTAKMPSWLLAENVEQQVAEVQAMHLLEYITDQEFGSSQGKSIRDIRPEKNRINACQPGNGDLRNQNVAVVSFTRTDQITVSWWEHGTMNNITLPGRKYKTTDTTTTERNPIPRDAIGVVVCVCLGSLPVQTCTQR